MMRFERVQAGNLELLRTFLDTAGRSLETFTYFSRRELSIVLRHQICVLAMLDGVAIGYGHIEKEGPTWWLGVCIAEAQCGKGHGRSIMQHLMEHCRDQGIPRIDLSVKTGNLWAIALYRSLGFRQHGEDSSSCYMHLSLSAGITHDQCHPEGIGQSGPPA